MPVADTVRLLEFIQDTDEFQPYMHWADEDAWEVSIPVIPGPGGGDVWVSPWAQIHFPAGQLDVLVKVITEDSHG
jgi:hypothetical protein